MSGRQEERLAFAGFAGIESRPRWYALQTRARHEKRISADLEQKCIRAFAPTSLQAHRWSDRTKIVEVPLFSCYVFVNLAISSDQRLAALKTPGVFRFVNVSGVPAEIPDSQIESVQKILDNALPISTCGFLHLGQKVRILGGALDGVEGILKGHKGAQKLVISVDLIQQSLEITVEGYCVEPVEAPQVSGNATRVASAA